MPRKKKQVVVQEKAVSQPQVKVIPIATKAYIYDKMDKLPIAQIAADTGLTQSEVEKLIVSKELDTRPNDGTQQPNNNLRRYDIKGDTVSLTPAQARVNDMVTKTNEGNNLEALKKTMGKDLEMIVLRNVD